MSNKTKLKTLQAFAAKLASDQISLDAKYVQIVDDRFWDLISEPNEA